MFVSVPTEERERRCCWSCFKTADATAMSSSSSSSPYSSWWWICGVCVEHSAEEEDFLLYVPFCCGPLPRVSSWWEES